MRKLLLKTMLLLCALIVGSGTMWGADVLAYTLQPASGSNSGYANNCDIEIDGITWNLTGNSTMQPWRIGGKSLSSVNRTLYSKTAISDNITKIEVTHGAASSITVNSWTVIVSKNSDFSSPVSTLTPTFAANTTTTINRPDGADWSNCYFKFVYNVSVSGTSNKFFEFSEAKFYKAGSSGPVQLDAPELTATAGNGSVTLEWDEISNASSYTIQYADNSSFTGATTITDATSPKEITGLTNGTTYYFKAMTVGDGTNYLSSDYGDAVPATPANVSKITITQNELTNFTNSYNWYEWIAGGVSGQAYAYKNNGMQFNSSKDGYWIYNTSAIPGTITSVKMVKASGTDRSWTLKAGTSAILTTDDGTQIGSAQTVGTSGATWNVEGSYKYFCLFVSGGSTVISSIEITYIPSTDPAISASDVDIAYDATSGSIAYTLTNEVTGGVLSATSSENWLTIGTVDDTTVPFTCSANEANTERTATVTLTYTYGNNETVTKDVTVTQAEHVVINTYTLATAITSGKHYIITNGSDKAMGVQHDNNRAAVDVSRDTENDVVSAASNSGVREFVIYGPDANGRYSIYDETEGGYLYAASSSSNNLKTQKTNNDNGLWTISFEDRHAVITAQGTYTRNKMYYNSGSTLFSCYASQSTGMWTIYLYEKDNEATPTSSVSVSSEGYATFCSENALDFTSSSIYAYKASVAGENITFTRVQKVPANTGVLLYADGGASESVPSLTGAADDVTGNLFVAATEEIASLPSISGGNVNYILNKGVQGIGFYKAADQKVGAGKAYLAVPEENANIRGFISFDFSDPTTGVAVVKNELQGEAAYDMQGRRVNTPKNGLYIINGKKVLVK